MIVIVCDVDYDGGSLRLIQEHEKDMASVCCGVSTLQRSVYSAVKMK